jgi:hypothetical protein
MKVSIFLIVSQDAYVFFVFFPPSFNFIEVTKFCFGDNFYTLKPMFWYVFSSISPKRIAK